MSAEGSSLRTLMLRSRLTLAVAESATCGQVQARIGAISGASDFFAGGITAYALEQKVRLLGVDRAMAEADRCVSARVASGMAAGACRLFSADIAVATTGYAEAGPEGGDVPFIWWALHHEPIGGGASRNPIVRTGRLEFAGSPRVDVQRDAARAVIDLLERYLERI